MTMNSIDFGMRKPWPKMKLPSFYSRAPQRQLQVEEKPKISREELLDLFRDKLRPDDCRHSHAEAEQISRNQRLRKALYN